MTAPPHRHASSDGDAFDAALAHEIEGDDTFDYFDRDDYPDDDYDLFDDEDELTELDEAILDLVQVILAAGPTTVAELADAVLAVGIYTLPNGTGDDTDTDSDAAIEAKADTADDDTVDDDTEDYDTEDYDDGRPADREELEQLIRDLVFYENDYWVLEDRIDRHDRMVDGTIFTHRLTAAELIDHRIPLDVDLYLAEPALATETDETDETDDTDETLRLQLEAGPTSAVIVIPPGQLGGLVEGDLIGFRNRAGILELEPVGHTGSGEAEVAGLLRTLQPVLDDGQGDDLLPHLLHALLHEPTLFTHPVPPLTELLHDAGLSRDGFAFGPPDRIWRVAGVDGLVRRATVSYELDPCCIDALRLVETRWRAERLGLIDHADAPSVAAVLDALDHGDVAPAAAEGIDSLTVGDELRAFAESLLAAAGPDAVGARLLVAQLAEQRGDIERAERFYTEVLALDADRLAPLESLARMAYDRSDFPTASRLYRRIYEPTHPYVESTELLTRLLITAGRNDRCPCGSGRKYKVCHLGRILVEPSQQPYLILAKLAGFAVNPSRRHVLALASLMADLDLDVILATRFLFESFLLAPANADDYRHLRGPLLPDDERALLDRMVDAPLRLVEVTGSEPPDLLTLNDVLTGEQLRAGAPDDVRLAGGEVAFIRIVDELRVGELTLIQAEAGESALELLRAGQPTLVELYRWFADDL